ncbi:MAG: hypothetical protein ACYSRQ_00735 [Planctomycetota bacterium]|jgi:hypothetical protein
MSKKTIVIFLLTFFFVGSIITFVVNAQSGGPASEGPAWGNVTFSNQLYNLIFFDHDTGQVYIYSDDGKIQEIWELSQLGKNLVRKYDAKEPGVTR